MDPEHLAGVARYVAKLLAEGRYEELEQASHGVRYSAEQLQSLVQEIGLPLAMPPERDWRELDATAVRNRPGAFQVQFDLWTTKGKSDWTVQLTLYSRNGEPVVEVDDILAG